MQVSVSKHRIAFSLISFVRSLFSLVELLIMSRIILDFLRASSEATFVYLINRLTDPLLKPFAGTFPPYELQGSYVIQSYAILALIVYSFIGYLIVRGISALSAHKPFWRKDPYT